MVRSEVNINMAERFPHWPAGDVALATKLFFEILSEALIEEQRIELRGFGTFEVRKRSAKTARNPRTRKQVEVGVRGRVHFRAGRNMRKVVDASKSKFPIKKIKETRPSREEA
ncbi:integration host factor subunit beta [Candidatus Comchoanobacter bicostacola]|uniref:Integration host factor subunit beta n=1 Tax=Candidatus Comchoanobacter bicostacola TaxID=2919598 RepID=A0ABY5DK16_9GAMM|nr:HU family DNA-binding protein [Candidatus Comchoanobacter bicostacola]UTC24500.1 integration host factor subunit beta [Candidatus Comchoanobacter bicostacola]